MRQNRSVIEATEKDEAGRRRTRQILIIVKAAAPIKREGAPRAPAGARGEVHTSRRARTCPAPAAPAAPSPASLAGVCGTSI
ncbi:hypothetical protein EVAR_20612_1 [Eumeta japonica]|uniref:Uncharacterized protein n=1 Tax=Eumeta variegata TaxID=151549 RepID=A0A4C1USE9_EUMVA|nr:hypothetical protein EVAR_20612_1 [Eumeta japonica]